VPGDGRLAVGAHVTTVLSGLVLIAVAFTVPHLRYEARGATRLGWLFVFSAGSGWLFNVAKAAAAVHALELNGQTANDVLFGIGGTLVVAPLLVGTAAWAWGLRR
jgi:(hydroxyamino)benzene mutase